jgi:predicted RNA-binding protein YlqC (UPF0109 family)
VTDEYVDGDVNLVDDEAGTIDDAVLAPRVLEYIARALADSPDAVAVSVQENPGRGVKLSLSVDADDLGRVIGRRGRTASALRTIVAAAGARDGVATSVDILD